MISGSAAKQKAGSALEGWEEWVEQHAGAVLVVLLCLLFVALVGLAASDYLWYDELVIVRVAALPGWHDIWNFYASGLDTIGLLYALILHALRVLPADEEIRSRLPAIVSFLAMLGCVFVFVRRRYAAVYAFAVVLMLTTAPLLTEHHPELESDAAARAMASAQFPSESCASAELNKSAASPRRSPNTR